MTQLLIDPVDPSSPDHPTEITVDLGLARTMVRNLLTEYPELMEEIVQPSEPLPPPADEDIAAGHPLEDAVYYVNVSAGGIRHNQRMRKEESDPGWIRNTVIIQRTRDRLYCLVHEVDFGHARVGVRALSKGLSIGGARQRHPDVVVPVSGDVSGIRVRVGPMDPQWVLLEDLEDAYWTANEPLC